MKKALTIVAICMVLSILAGLPVMAVGPDSTPPVVYAFGMSASAAKTVDCAGSAAVLVQAKASDLNGVKAMTTQIKRPGDATWRNFEMAKKPDGYWRYYIPKSAFTRPYVGIWQVRVVAYDTFNNSTKSGIKTINVSTCPDTTGPVIGTPTYTSTLYRPSASIVLGQKPLGQAGGPQFTPSGCTPTSTSVTVTVTDGNGLGVAEVSMYYRAPGGASYTEVTMTNIGGNTYQATLGPFNVTGIAEFFIEAHDLAGNEKSTDGYNVTIQNCGFCPPAPLTVIC